MIEIKEIHIFDIDGCIFPSKNKKGQDIMPNKFESKITPKEIINKMKRTELFPSFISFYKLISNNIKDTKNYFITGRSKKDFQNITLKQLSILNTKKNRDTLIFFPDNKPLTKRSYYEFKIYQILKIITENNGNSKINIYDDKYQHFIVLEERLKDIELNNINFSKVREPEYFWNLKNEEYKNLIEITQKHLKMNKK